jgi:hypothetical protein
MRCREGYQRRLLCEAAKFSAAKRAQQEALAFHILVHLLPLNLCSPPHMVFSLSLSSPAPHYLLAAPRPTMAPTKKAMPSMQVRAIV